MWADVRSERQGLVGWAGWLRSGRVRRCYGSSDMGLAVSVGSGETGVVRGGDRANELLVSDDADGVLVVRCPTVGGACRASIVGVRVGRRCGAVRLAGRPCAGRLWCAGPACRADGLPAAAHRYRLGQRRARRRAVPWRFCSRQSCSPCENRAVTPDGHTCPIDFKAAETVDYKSSLSKAP